MRRNIPEFSTQPSNSAAGLLLKSDPRPLNWQHLYSTLIWVATLWAMVGLLIAHLGPHHTHHSEQVVRVAVTWPTHPIGT
jgi:hypothetical protein